MEDRSRSLLDRLDALVAPIAIVLVAAAALLGPAAARAGGTALTAVLQALLVLAGLVGAFVLYERTGRRTLITVVVVGAAARLALLAWPPLQSNDVYRYLWDGRVLLNGLDPYVLAPDAPQLHALRTNWLYAFIDWRQVPTLYPPIDLVLYALGAGLSNASVVPLKAVMLVGDFGVMALVARFLHARRLPLGRLAIYAWSPLAIVEFGLNGHEEGWAIAFLLATIMSFGNERRFGAALSLAGAVLTKLYPAAFIPVLFARRGYTAAAALCLAVIGAAYLPFVLWNRDVLGFLHAFAFQYHFNDSLHAVLGTVGSALVFVVALAIAAFARVRGASVIAIVLGLEITYFLLSPNVYPWYLTVFAALIPLIPSAFGRALRPLSLALIAWTALAPLAYFAPWTAPSGSPLIRALYAIEYAPLVIALIWYVVRDGRRFGALIATAVAMSGCSVATASPTRPLTPPAARGAAFYAERCALCHTPTPSSFIGPDLTHVARRRSTAALFHHISTSVPNGTTFSHDAVAALVAYLEMLNERPNKK